MQNDFDYWRKVEFRSEDPTQFTNFVRDLRSFLKYEMKGAPLSLVRFEVGHFYLYGFLSNLRNGLLTYFNVGDVRYNLSGHWADNVLYRLADHIYDYSGKKNHYCAIEKLIWSVSNIDVIYKEA